MKEVWRVSAAFTVVNGKVTGVAVSAAVGKENAMAHAFNYNGINDNGLQNSAFALGAAGTVYLTGLGDPIGGTITTAPDTNLGATQGNSFTTGYSIQLGTASGDVVNRVPAAP
ncbi:MAG: hypothetical protein RSE13_22540 [Planktothrix sp. GU0601_MAG3]|nr:MAG: hypothetical protein RSE13_22540 [Planktothrix sp. GU0601_MAG3]